MKTCWLKRGNGPDCILFAAGWGMGPEPFQEVDFGSADVCMAYDWRSLDHGDFAALLPIAEKGSLHLLAWSMGAWAAAWLSQNHSVFSALRFRSATAIGGTCRPIDDQFGIPVRHVDQMLRDFSPAVLTEFYRSMFAGSEETEQFLRRRPDRPVEELREELLALRAACASQPAPPDIYSCRLVTSRDRIFPARSQVRAWGRDSCASLAVPHFPFYQLAEGWFLDRQCRK